MVLSNAFLFDCFMLPFPHISLVKSMILLISPIRCSFLYIKPLYFFSFKKLWRANLKVSARVLISFAPATLPLRSQLCTVLMNGNMITLFMILAKSTFMVFSVKSVKVWIYSCSVSSGHCFPVRLLDACTSVAFFSWFHANLFSLTSIWDGCIHTLYYI